MITMSNNGLNKMKNEIVEKNENSTWEAHTYIHLYAHPYIDICTYIHIYAYAYM